MTKQKTLQPWKVLKTSELYDGSPWVKLSVEKVRLPDGKVIDDYYQIQVSDYTLIFAETTDGRIIMERQYKHGFRQVSLMLPAGSIEPGEPPLQAAKRELLEETGYVSDDWQSMGQYVIHGNYMMCQGNLFRARGAHQIAEPNSGDLEEMEILLMTPEELTNAVRNGTIVSLSSAALIAMATNPRICE